MLILERAGSVLRPISQSGVKGMTIPFRVQGRALP